jgi:hypothetical protein
MVGKIGGDCQGKMGAVRRKILPHEKGSRDRKDWGHNPQIKYFVFGYS